MKVNNRLTHEQFVDAVCKSGEYDMIDWQEEFGTELVETGSVSFTLPDGSKYVAALVVDKVFY